jgi:hypothetical protein
MVQIRNISNALFVYDVGVYIFRTLVVSLGVFLVSYIQVVIY